MDTNDVTLIAISEINADPATMQARQTLSRDVITDYSELYREGNQLPPIRIVCVDEMNWLVDGFHRLAAQKKLGFEEVRAIITEGTFADALQAAASANVTHGLRRSKGDALKAALLAVRALYEMQGSGKKKRPTVDQVVDMAHVGRSTVEQAFEYLKAAGADLGEKDKRGRKKKESTTDSTTEAHSEYTSGDDAIDPETGEELVGTALVMRQAERRMQDTTELMVKIRANVGQLNPADYEDANSDVRLNWEAIATTLRFLADEITSTLGEPATSESDSESPEGDTAEQARADAA